MHHVDRNSGILHEEEKFSLDERQNYQEKFLREIVGTAYAAGTPLKAALDKAGAKPDDIRTVADLAKLPITGKKDLSEAQKANPPFGGFLTVPMSDLLRVHISPGPIYDPVAKEPRYWRWGTALYSAGFRRGDLVVNTFAYHLTPAGHMFEDGVAEIGATTIPTGVGNTDDQVGIMRSLPVTGFIGTPSFLPVPRRLRLLQLHVPARREDQDGTQRLPFPRAPQSTTGGGWPSRRSGRSSRS